MRTVLTLALALALGACTSTGDAGLNQPHLQRPSREALADLADQPDQPTVEEVSRFGGKLYLVLLDDKTHPSLRGGRSLWATSQEIAYRPSNGPDTITVPKGFVTDLTSIPRIFWTLLPPDGPWVKAAVIHDYLYYTTGTGRWKRHDRSITRAQDYSRAEADWILRDALRDRHVDSFKSEVVYLAVRAGGGHAWGR